MPQILTVPGSHSKPLHRWDTDRSPPTSSGKHCPDFGFSSSVTSGSPLAQSDSRCISVGDRVKVTRGALTRNSLTRARREPPRPSAATNASLCIVDQTLPLAAAAARQQSERAGSMPTGAARRGRAATTAGGGRVELCSPSLPPRFSHPSASPGRQSQDAQSKHSLLHRATTQVFFHTERLPLPPKCFL